MHNAGHRLADIQPAAIRFVLFVVLMLVSIGVARTSYLVYERPMIRLVRRVFSIRPRAETHDEDMAIGGGPASTEKASVPPSL